MAYPDKTTPRSYGGAVPPSYLTTDIPNYYVANQAITIESAAGWYEVSDTGQATTTPLGTRGPFVVTVNAGEANEERILCSDIDIEGNFLTVWTDGVLNGRGYDGTIIQWHYRQTTQNKTNDIFHGASAVESLQFNEGIIAALIGGQGGQGAQGVQGAQGTQGAQGNQGATGTGTQGSQGAQGATGTGTQGSQGAQGAQGAGTQGSQGTQGDQGPQGNDGSQGTQGNDGAQGSQGNDGTQGPQGNDGAQGFQGNDGPQGNDGAQGTQGTVGASFPTYLAVINSPDGIATDGSFVEQTATFTVTGGPDAYVSPNRVTLIVSGGSCSYTGYISNVIPGVGTTTFQVYLDGYTGTNSGDQINWYMSLSGIKGIQGAQGSQGSDGAQGSQGNDGSQGSQGNDGAQGFQGDQGLQGYQGQADRYATYSAAYTNIPTTFPFTDDISVNGGLAYSAGQGIVIAIDGTDYAVATVNAYDAVTGILNFTIAASTDIHGNPFQGFSWGYAVNLDGAVGPQGTQGFQGDQGPQGNDGSQGSQGNDGAQGSQGNDGAQGPQGDQGQAALWNFSGPYNPGLIYTTGDVVTYEGQTWYRLIYGAPGRTPGDNIWWTLVAAEGNQGAQGTQGLTGDPGIYESADGVPPVNEDILWLDETVAGYAGPQGPQGVQGVQGARGYQGSVGAQGASGTNGTNGSQGAQGTQGLQGSTGSQGSQGNAGTQGPQGASGTNGSQGPQGSQGNQGNSFSTDDSGWIAVSSFTNSFVVGAAVAYRKLNGIVYLRGSVQSGTPANAAFTLPTGYRPSETSVFAIQQYGLTTNNYITINTDGTVVPQTASAWLNNVVYPIG